MGISKKYLNTHSGVVTFDPCRLAAHFEKELASASFCLLMGSAAEGKVAEGSDLDLAFYLTEPLTLDFYATVEAIIADYLPGVRCDIGILNKAEPVFHFEALKGTLLFARSRELYASFFSLTCREYESQMFDYAKQHKYRVEAGHAL
ncbi:MAG: nucleotidyltransferase domain-containing protein [Deltaproteobacteria bacterium]|nr:nucleotidyltransferase domain-containing protein [Deltaproteobacteria bacterium]